MELAFDVVEMRADGRRAARFSTRTNFERRDIDVPMLRPGLLTEDPRLRVRAAILDHQIPCLAFALEETAHVNIWKNRLEALHLPIGPWLRDLKAAILSDLPDDTPFSAWWHEEGRRCERVVPLGVLKDEATHIVAGLKIGYIVDVVHHRQNAEKIRDLVKGADILFIETPFLDADRTMAARKFHLTARQAGELARASGIKRLTPFHFSPRYQGRAVELEREAQDAFAGR